MPHHAAAAVLLLAFALPSAPPAGPLVYERMEGSAVGKIEGGVTFGPDVVGYGGLAVANHASAALDGKPGTCINHGVQAKVSSPDFTVEAFVKLTAPPDHDAVAADWSEDGDHRAWALVVLPGGGLRFDVMPDGQFHPGNMVETAGRLLRPGAWYHVAAVSQGQTSRIYLNGRLASEAKRALPGIFTGGRANLKLGAADRYAGQTRTFHGRLDEVRITPRALAPEDFLRTKEPMPEAKGPVPAAYEMPFAAKTQEEAAAWQKRARARLLELVQKQEPRRTAEKSPLDLRIGQAEDKGDYTLAQGSFRGNSGESRFPFLLAVPKGKGPFPAMLCLHGHGGSAGQVFDSKTIYRDVAGRFARGGYVVLAPSFPHRKYAAMTLWDLVRSVDVLASRPEVDPARMGVAGLSMGGEWTMWAAACDERLKVAVVSGWMCTTEGVFSVPNCPCWELPGFVEMMDVCEVHLLIAPRPVLFESAEHDGCFPIRHSRDGFARVRAGYGVFGAPQACAQDVWPAGHEWHGTAAYPFVDKILGGRAAKAE